MFKTTDQTHGALRPNEDDSAIHDDIIKDVLCRLGCPDNLHMVQVKPVCTGKYRVNVYVRAEAATFRVAHSYFVHADAGGKILVSSPAIVRVY